MAKIVKVDKQAEGITYAGSWSNLAGGTEIQAESIENESYGSGSLTDIYKPLANQEGASAVALQAGVDFEYDDYIDENGSYDIYDDNTSGAIDSGKSIRVIENSKNVSDATGLGLKVRAKNLSSIVTPPSDECYVDPASGKIVLPRPWYWNKFESLSDLENPTIGTSMSTYNMTDGTLSFPSGKFGNCLKWYSIIGTQPEIVFYPFGENYESPQTLTISYYYQREYVYTRHDIRVNSIYISIWESYGTQSNITIDGSQVATSSVFIDADVWHHFYIIINENGLTSGNTIEVYMDDSLYMSTDAELVKNDEHFYLRMKDDSGSYRHSDKIDNLKIWNHVVSEDPSFEYNSGIGREDALHAIYSSANGYKPNNLQVGGIYIASSDNPAKLAEPTGSGNEEVQLEDISNYGYGNGSFGGAGIPRRDDFTPLVKDVDYTYGQSLDGSGTAPDIWDDNASGPLDTDKYLRIVHNGKNITDPTGLGLNPVAKYMSNGLLTPKSDELYFDPKLNEIVLPRPVYWSKCENWDNLVNAEIGTLTYSTFNQVWKYVDTGKFGNCLRWYSNWYSRLAVLNLPAHETYTISLWCRFGDLVSMFQLQHNSTGSFNTGSLRVRWGGHKHLIVNGTTVLGNTSMGWNGSTWKHIYIVFDKNNSLMGGKSIRIFFDGVEDISSTITPQNASNIQLSIGGAASDDNCNCFFDNIKIWDEALEDPSFEYNGGTGREDALHEIYGADVGYKPAITSVNNGGVGYYYAEGGRVDWKF